MNKVDKGDDPFEWAKFVIRNRDERGYVEAYSVFIREARTGNPEAHYCLGLMFARGQGIDKDYPAALSWFTKAYDLGFLNSGYFLGKMHLLGLGTPKDVSKAERYFESVADRDARATYELGLLNFTGKDRRRDLSESARWMMRSADAGNPEAQFVLGQYYKAGAGVPKDTVKAVEWLSKAATNQHKGAQILLGNMYRIGDGVDVDIQESDRWYDMADGRTFRRSATPQLRFHVRHVEIRQGDELPGRTIAIQDLLLEPFDVVPSPVLVSGLLESSDGPEPHGPMERFARTVRNGDAREDAYDALHPQNRYQSLVQPAPDPGSVIIAVDVDRQLGAPGVCGTVLQPVRVGVRAHSAILLPDNPRILVQGVFDPPAEILFRRDLRLEGNRGVDVLGVDGQHRGRIGGFRHPDRQRTGDGHLAFLTSPAVVRTASYLLARLPVLPSQIHGQNMDHRTRVVA